MPRKKVTEETPPPETREISLLRAEERTERKEITADQKVERLAAAAAMFGEAAILDAEAAGLKEDLKAKKQRAAAKHQEGERIALDAQNGTMAHPFPVIVERHPSHPTEMLVWRVADGLSADEVIGLEVEGEERIAAREAQGCTLIETRAMMSDELEMARSLDHARANPPLPFEQPTPTVEGAEGDQVEGAEATGDATAESAPKKGHITCPYIIEEPGEDPQWDSLCRAEGAARRKGFCAEHYEETGGKNGSAAQVHMLARRTRRAHLAREAIEREAEEQERQLGEQQTAGSA